MGKITCIESLFTNNKLMGSKGPWYGRAQKNYKYFCRSLFEWQHLNNDVLKRVYRIELKYSYKDK